MTTVDAANVKPGEQPPMPTTRDELLIEALRSANRVSLLLNEIAAWAHAQTEGYPGRPLHNQLERLEDLLVRRFSDCSGLHLFVAASNLRIDLPPDLSDDDDEIETEE